MSRIHANNYLTTITGSITNASTTLVASTVTGFPTIGAGVVTYLTLQNGSDIEIVKATSNSGTTITIVRAQEDTIAKSFAAGSTLSIRPTKGSFDGKVDVDSPTFTGTVTIPTPFILGAVSVLPTGTELNYVDGVTSSIQTQLDSKVTGVDSSTDNAAVRFDSTTGKLIQNSGVIIDDNNNVSYNNGTEGYTTTATAAATTTLTVASTEQQYFTGSTTQTVVLPLTSTLSLGHKFKIINNSSGVVTVQSSGANAIIAMNGLSWAEFIVIAITGTGVASWDYKFGTNASTLYLPQTINANRFLVTGGSNNVVTGVGNTANAIPGTNSSGTIAMKAGTANQVLNVNSGATDTAFTSTLTSITLVTPALGTPSSGALSSCTAYPQSALTGLGTNVSTFLGTPSSANLAAALTDGTGSGAAVFANTPTLVTPALGTPASGVLTNCTGTPIGTTTNNDAAAGQVGEYISSIIASGSAVTSLANASSNVTSISLTAGDWEVYGNVNWVTFGVGVSQIYAWSSATSATGPDQSLYNNLTCVGMTAPFGFSIPSRRYSLSGTTTIYLSCFMSVSSGNGTACGGIYARRVR